ncbi:hypothetical protein [Phyllobacterium sp. CL33Tsu]|nr:hypothetical protein [Phyllobacterium sp. CL33Tsu]
MLDTEDDGESLIAMIRDGMSAGWSLDEVETALRAFVRSFDNWG